MDRLASENLNPMLASETFLVNMYGTEDQVNSFNSLVNDSNTNYLEIRDFVQKLIKFTIF